MLVSKRLEWTSNSSLADTTFSLLADRLPLGDDSPRADDDRRSGVPRPDVELEEEAGASAFFLPPPPRMGLMMRAPWPGLWPFPVMDDDRPRLCARAWAWSNLTLNSSTSCLYFAT